MKMVELLPLKGYQFTLRVTPILIFVLIHIYSINFSLSDMFKLSI